MVFSSPLFLFVFLPVVLTVYGLLWGIKIRNLFLLVASLFFYAWGEPVFVLLLLASTVANFFLGRWVERAEEPARRKLIVGAAIVFNIGLLCLFKYTNWAAATVNSLLHFAGVAPVHVPTIRLPLGISFFTFHALSYVIDIFRRKWQAARHPGDVALYIFFFPQLIAGPILRWNAIGPQLAKRTMRRDLFAEGVRRFVGGLAKKALIANTVAWPADQIFSLPADQLSTPVAWFGVLCYTLQIYFDFSGYSDMAIGMGKMFGFEFMENFQFPYISQSIREFWRRWHISLSTWFRDYLYIPLGGNRISERRTYFNLVVVFFLCGLWHGANWTFVAWGLYHGIFLALERTRLGDWEARWPRWLRHVYALLVVMMGWVIFRSVTLSACGKFFAALLGQKPAPLAEPLARYATHPVVCALTVGIIFAGPAWAWLKSAAARVDQNLPQPYRPLLQITGEVLEIGLVVILFVASAAWLANGTYNPFIYFRF